MAKKLSLSDLTRDDRRPSWAADVRQNYLRNKEQDENAYARAKAVADQVAEAEGVVLPEAQIRDMARQYRETGDFDVAIPPPADFSGVTATSETFPTPQENPGLLNRIGTYVGSAVDAAQSGIQNWMAADAYMQADTAPAAATQEELSTPGGLITALTKGILGGQRAVTPEARQQLFDVSAQQRAAAEANNKLVQGTRDLLDRQGGVEKWTTQAVLDAAQSPTGALSLIGGPLATVGVTDVQNQEYMNARLAGLSQEEAADWAAAQAAPELIGFIPAGKLLSLGRKAAAKEAGTEIAEKLARPGITAGLRAARTMAGEGLEEATTGALQDLTAAVIAGTSEQENLKNYAQKQLPKSAGEFVENRLREAAAGAVFGAIDIPNAVREGRNQFNEQVAERTDSTTEAATANAQAMAEANAQRQTEAPAEAPVLPTTRRQRITAEQEALQRQQDNVLLREAGYDVPDTTEPVVNEQAPEPVVAPTPEKPVAPKAKPGTVDATLEDISTKLALGMQEQTQASTPEGETSAFDPEQYKAKIRDVVGDLARANTQQTVDAVNLINQGKLILAPSPESIGREATTDVAQFEPSEGKMYLYTDRLNKGDTLGAVIRTYHEATHAGQFNDREGRPDVMQQIMGKGPAAKAQGTILRAAQNGNAIARRAVDKAQAAAGGNANVENLEILPYFVGEVVQARGSTLGQLRGVANDILSSAKRFVGKATGKQFDVDMRDLEKAVSGVGREIVQTEVAPTEGDTASMIYGESAKDFEEAKAAGRVYTSTADGRSKFVLSDADGQMKPDAPEVLGSTELSSTDTVPVSSILDHEVLFRNMPEAGNIQVRVDPTMGERNMGRYWPQQNLIEINPKVANGESNATLRETLMHEIQHWVQEQDGGLDAFRREKQPESEKKAVRDFEAARAANDAAGIRMMEYAGRIIDDMPSQPDKALARSIINSPRTPVRKALDFGRLVGDLDIDISDIEAKEAYNQFADTLNDYRKKVTPYNEANAANYKRYLAMPSEAEAFFTQRNVDTPQNELPINPEMEDLEFGTPEGADVGRMAVARELRQGVDRRGPKKVDETAPQGWGATLGMSDPNEINPITKRWAPAWLTGLVRADKGLSKVDNEIIEHAIASPAGYRMKAEAEMGKYDYHLDKQAAQQGKTKEALNKEILAAIDGLPKDLTTHAENVAAFNKAMEPFGKAGDSMKAMRDQVDELTLSILQQRADSGIPLTEADKKLYKTLVENMGKYTHRQYAAHAGKLGNKYATAVWKDYEKYKKGKGRENPVIKANYEKVADATKYLVDNNLSIPEDTELSKLGADQVRNLYNTWGRVGNPDGLSLEQMKEELAENRDRINGNKDALVSEAETIAKELLGLAPVNNPITTYYRGGKQDTGILKQREAIPPVLRSLMGEIVDPSMRMVMTVAKQAEFVGRNRMLLELARSTEGDILPPGTARPAGWTKLEGQGYGPLEGYVASPNMVAAIGDVQQQLATFEQAVAMSTRNPRELGTAMTNKALDAWGVAAGTSKMLQVIWSPMNFVYNFVGGPFTMLTNGNISPVNFGKGLSAATDLIKYAVNPKGATDVATRLVRNDVVDSAFVGEIKNEQYRELRKVVMEMAGRSNPKLENLGEILHKSKAGFKETYAMMDVLYKIANFYHQVDTLTDFYKKNGDERTAEQIDREAADVVKRTNFTYRRVAPMLKAIESKGFSAFGPYMHEVFRTQIAGVFQGISEIQRAGEAKTPEARNVMLLQGTKRLTGTAAAWGMIGLASKLLSGITFGEDDDENEAKRALLPEYLQDQDFVEIGKDAKGNPVMFNVSRFDPIGPATDLMRGILQGGIEPDKLSEKMIDLYVTPRIGPQFVKAVGTMIDPKVKISKVPLAQELAPEQYSTLLDIAKQVGIPARVAKAWTNVAETMYPGIASSWRSSNARPTSPDDMTTSIFNTSTYLGMTLQALDPAKPVRFASMSYTDSVKQGRSEIAEMFKDNPNRTSEQVMAQILDSRSNERQAYDDLKKTYDGARAVGVPQRQLMADMKQQKLNTQQIKAITSGVFASTIISADSLKTYEQRELKDAPKSEHKEIKQRWKDIRALLSSASRQLNESEDE